MKNLCVCLSVGCILLLVGITYGAGASQPKAAATSKLLRCVVHFSDNDVRFHTSHNTNVFVDPVCWPTDDMVVASGLVKPDLILITHSHEDHFQPTILREYADINPNVIIAGPPDVVRTLKEKGIKALEISPDNSYTLAGVKFKTTPSYSLEGDLHPRVNRWMGYILQIDGATYYITGDTEPFPEMANFKVDVLMPLLSGCGGNIDQALKVAELCKARLVVPVHTSGREDTIKRYIAKLPKGVHGAYYINAKLIIG